MGNAGIHLTPLFSLARFDICGVLLFFVLSSFLLTLPPVKRQKSQFLELSVWSIYARRRFLRIFPLFFLVLLVSHIFSTHLNVPYFVPISRSEFVNHLLLREGKNIFWAIPVEVKYYVLLPFVAFLFCVPLKKNPLAAALFVVAASILIRFVLWPPWRPEEFEVSRISLARNLPVFLMGSLTALLQSRIFKPKRLKPLYARGLLNLVAIMAFLTIVLLIPRFWTSVSGQEFRWSLTYVHSAVFGFLWAFFLFLCLSGAGLVSRVLGSTPLRFMGVVSYSAYLWHLPVMCFIQAKVDAHPSVKVLLIIIIVLVVSTISHVLVEKPFMKLGLPNRRS